MDFDFFHKRVHRLNMLFTISGELVYKMESFPSFRFIKSPIAPDIKSCSLYSTIILLLDGSLPNFTSEAFNLSINSVSLPAKESVKIRTVVSFIFCEFNFLRNRCVIHHHQIFNCRNNVNHVTCLLNHFSNFAVNVCSSLNYRK